MRYLATVLFALLFFAQNVFAGLPPTTVKNRLSSTKSGFFTVEVPNLQAVKTSATNALIETGNKNFLNDASFESNGTVASTVSISGTGASAARDTADYIDGKQSMNVTLSSTPAQVFLAHILAPVSASVTYADQNWEFSAMIKTTVAGIQLCAYYSGTQKVCSSDVPTSGTWTKMTVNFPGPVGTETYFGYALKTTATSTGTVRVDDAYVGPARNIGSVAQATIAGYMEQAGATGCDYAETTSSGESNFVALGSGTGCSAWATSGGLSSSSANSPSATFNNMPPGDYEITLAGGFYDSIANQVCSFKIYDGTNYIGFFMLYNGGGNLHGGTLTGRVSYTTSASRSFQVTAADNNTGSCSLNNSQAGRIAAWTFKRFPSSSETVYRADLVGWRVDATLLASTNPSLGLATVSSSTEMTSANLALTQNTGSSSVGIACASGTASVVGGTTCTGNRSMGITWNQPTTGDVRVCTTTSWNGNAAASSYLDNTWQMGETSASSSTIIQAGRVVTAAFLQGQTTNTNLSYPIRICDTFTFTSTGQKTVRLFYKQTVSGTANGSQMLVDGALGRNNTWTVEPLTQNVPAPLLVNSVVAPDNTGGITRINTIVSKSANYTATEAEETIVMGGSNTLSLPAAASFKGKKYHVIQGGAGITTIDPNGAELVCGISSIKLSGDKDAVTIQSDGTEWRGLDDSCYKTVNAFGTDSGTAMANQKNGSFSGRVHNATGSYTYTFAAPFSSMNGLSCQANDEMAGSYGYDCRIEGLGTSAIGVICTNNNAAANMYHVVSCYGPR